MCGESVQMGESMSPLATCPSDFTCQLSGRLISSGDTVSPLLKCPFIDLYLTYRFFTMRYVKIPIIRMNYSSTIMLLSENLLSPLLKKWKQMSNGEVYNTEWNVILANNNENF